MVESIENCELCGHESISHEVASVNSLRPCKWDKCYCYKFHPITRKILVEKPKTIEDVLTLQNGRGGTRIIFKDGPNWVFTVENPYTEQSKYVGKLEDRNEIREQFNAYRKSAGLPPV